jgi:hypothetical protein
VSGPIPQADQRSDFEAGLQGFGWIVTTIVPEELDVSEALLGIANTRSCLEGEHRLSCLIMTCHSNG